MDKRTEAGFTLIELMIVVVIIGILAAIAIPNFLAMQDRAKEGSTKANMHTLQLACEDYATQNDGSYADQASTIAALLPASGANFKNPFDGTSASALEDRAAVDVDPGAVSGIVSYADSATVMYNIKGVGKATSGASFPLSIVLGSGE